MILGVQLALDDCHRQYVQPGVRLRRSPGGANPRPREGPYGVQPPPTERQLRRGISRPSSLSIRPLRPDCQSWEEAVTLYRRAPGRREPTNSRIKYAIDCPGRIVFIPYGPSVRNHARCDEGEQGLPVARLGIILPFVPSKSLACHKNDGIRKCWKVRQSRQRSHRGRGESIPYVTGCRSTKPNAPYVTCYLSMPTSTAWLPYEYSRIG